MANQNFTWGNGQNTSTGYDPNAANGNTYSWTDDDWARYYKNNPTAPGAPQTIDGGVVANGGTPAAPQQTPQQVATDSYIQRAQQGTAIDRNDPNIRQQVDPFAAAQERQRRQYETDQAERLSTQGMGNSGAMDLERRRAMETAGQNTGAFESQLIGRELENRRAEISDALKALGGMAESEQGRQLQRELANIDAAIKREGIQAGLTTSNNELALKDKLGMAGINVDLLRTMLQNQQFDKGQALDWSKFDWATNPMNPGNWSF